MLETLDMFVLLVAAYCIATALIDNLDFYNMLKLAGVPVSFSYASIPFYVYFKYVSYRDSEEYDLRELTDERVSKYKYRMFRVMVSFFVMLVWFSFSQILSMEAG